VKDELAQLQDRIDEEKRKQVELRSIKDKLGHSQYKNTDEQNNLRDRENELLKNLKDREFE
jgi:hypothetical protein